MKIERLVADDARKDDGGYSSGDREWAMFESATLMQFGRARRMSSKKEWVQV